MYLSLYNAGQLVTMQKANEDDIGIIEDGAFIVKDGKFAWVGKTRELKEMGIHADMNIDAEGLLVTPGFIDPHTHLVFAGSREDELDRKIRGESYIEILRSGGGINRTIAYTRKATESELLESSLSRLRQLIKQGVTTVEVKTGYCQDVQGEIKMLRVASQLTSKSGIDIVRTFLGLHAIPPEFSSSEDYSDFVIREMLPAIAKFNPDFADCFCEEGLFSTSVCRRYLESSRLLGLKLKVHADEFSYSHGAELAAEVGCTSADHLENSSSEGLSMMSSKNVSAVLLPGTAFYSRIKQPDFKSIKESGCTFALGTDLSPNSWIESPQLVMAIACVQLGMRISEAVSAFTIGAAKALSLEDRGMISVGKIADFVIHRFRNYMYLPYRVGGNYVHSVFKRGNLIYSSGEA
jgi:imidazolonepropionase